MSLKKGLELKRPILLLVSVMLIVGMAGVGAAAMPGRYVETHAIDRPTYCGACHPAQVEELSKTTHLEYFANDVSEYYEEGAEDYKGSGENMSMAEAVSGGCMMCHSGWANRENIHFKNPNINDSTASYDAIVISSSDPGANYTSYGQVWENLSALNGEDPMTPSCGGSAEHGMTCHAQSLAVAEAANGSLTEGHGHDRMSFFKHDMGSTRASGSNMKQVKMCGNCHFAKLPPTMADGTPNKAALENNTDEFFHYNYGGDNLDGNVTYTENSWAHSNVQCIDCHAHAGAGNVDSTDASK